MSKRRKPVYPMLAEMMNGAHISYFDMARMIGMMPDTFCNKMAGESDFSVTEAITIADILSDELDNVRVIFGGGK